MTVMQLWIAPTLFLATFGLAAAAILTLGPAIPLMAGSVVCGVLGMVAADTSGPAR